MAVAAAFITFVILVNVVGISRTTTIPCEASMIPVGEVQAPASGDLSRLYVGAGQAVNKGQIIGEITSEESQKHAEELAEELRAARERLWMMRSPPVVDVEQHRQTIKRWSKALARARRRCRGRARCATGIQKIKAKLERLQEQLQMAEASPGEEEIREQTDLVQKLEKKVQETRAGERTTVTSPRSAVVDKVLVDEGDAVKAKAPLVELVDPEQLRVVAKPTSDAPPPGTALDVTFSSGNQRQIVEAEMPKPSGRSIAFEVDAPVHRIDASASCTLAIKQGEISLWRSWMED
jgi:multidrug resistance efflux pump